MSTVWRVCLVGVLVPIVLACGGAGDVAAPVPDAADVTPEPGPASVTKGVAPPIESSPDGKCGENIVATEGWQGEWPGPVADVGAWVRIDGTSDPCGGETRRCKLKPGIYHPWADTPGVTYFTVRGKEPFKARRDIQVAETAVPKGQVVHVTHNYGEGMCGIEIGEKSTTGECPTGDDALWEALPSSGVEERQLFKPGCGVWLDLDEVLAQKKVRKGKLLEYGKAGGADAKGGL